jgi:capsular exopolysaccharide synthesis family protein
MSVPDQIPAPKPAKAPKKPNRLVSTLGTWLVDRINIFFRIRHYVKMIAQRWVILVVCTILGVIGAAYLALHSPNIYAAYSVIVISPKVIPQFQSGAVYIEEQNSFYEMQMTYMKTPKLLNTVERKMRESYPVRPLVVNPLPRKGPGTFQMVVESTDFEYARQYAKIWAQEFVLFKSDTRGNSMESQLTQKKESVNRLEKQLQKARDALLDFQKRNSIGNVPQLGEAAQKRLDENENRLSQLRIQRSLLEGKSPSELMNVKGWDPSQKRAFEPVSKDTPAIDLMEKFSDPSSQYTALRFQLRVKEDERKLREATLKPKHPYMIQLNEEIVKLNQKIQYQLDAINERRGDLVQSLKQDEEKLLPMIADLKTNVIEYAQIKYDSEKLADEVKTVSTFLESERKSLQSLEISINEEPPFTTLEEGVGDSHPIRPKREQMVFFGFLIGLGLGMALIYLLSRLDDRLELAEDIETELEESVLGQIPQVDASKLQHENVLITRLEEHNMFSEAIRGVRSAVMLSGGQGKKQVILVTSAVPADGKTTFTVNFAVTLAIAGYKVLLVDSDLRRGNVHNYFGEQRDPGFAEVLLGQLHWSDAVRPTEVKTLHAIHSGKLPNNPGELLISPITAEFITEARQNYDYIVFDCPPLTAIDDTFSLVSLADGLLFVVRSGQTSMRFAKNALMAVRQRGANLLGLVLNGITADNPSYYYQNYYHKYYSTEQPKKANLSSTPLPALKMAAPKRSGNGSGSIEGAASARSGKPATAEELALKEQLKAARFRARAQAREKAQSPGGITAAEIPPAGESAERTAAQSEENP